MFSTDLIESKSERVAINGVEPQMIGMLVSYAYTSEVYISKANVQVRVSTTPRCSTSPAMKSDVGWNMLLSCGCRLYWQQPTCWM